MIATKRIYLTEDKKSAVYEGDVRAAFLLAGIGGEIKDAEAKRLGLLDEPKPVVPPVDLPPPARETRVVKQTNKR